MKKTVLIALVVAAATGVSMTARAVMPVPGSATLALQKDAATSDRGTVVPVLVYPRRYFRGRPPNTPYWRKVYRRLHNGWRGRMPLPGSLGRRPVYRSYQRCHRGAWCARR